MSLTCGKSQNISVKSTYFITFLKHLTHNKNLSSTKILLLPKPNRTFPESGKPWFRLLESGTFWKTVVLHIVRPQPPPCSSLAAHQYSVSFSRINVICEHNPGSDTFLMLMLMDGSSGMGGVVPFVFLDKSQMRTLTLSCLYSSLHM